jgi:hypothetical protein
MILSTEKVLLILRTFKLSPKILRLSRIISHLTKLACSQEKNLVCSKCYKFWHYFKVTYLHSVFTGSLHICIKTMFLKHIRSAQADKPFT